MNNIFKYSITCLVILSCAHNSKGSQGTDVKDPIVIIIDKVKNNYDTVFFNEGEAIMKSPAFRIKLSPDKTLTLEAKDTIEFIPEREQTIISHKFLPYAYADFISHPGDSILIKYIDDVSYISIPNRRTNLFDVNYDYLKIERYPLIMGMRLLDIIAQLSTFLMKNQTDNKKIKLSNKSILDKYLPLLLNELETERVWLDSLHKVELISDNDYDFYKERNKYTTLHYKKPNDILSELHRYNDSIYVNDHTGYYRGYMYNLSSIYLGTILNSLNGDRATELYKFIENSEDIQGMLSVDLRKNLVVNILKQAPFEVRKEYFSKFASSINDTTLIRNMEKEYKNMLDPEVASCDNIILQTATGERTTLDKVLKQYIGKVVYVDFWASWCEPCLREMPFSKDLREDVMHQDIVFVYLSIYDEQDKWEKAWGKALVTDQQNNYLILNSRDADFIKKYKINSIPRYMIFDKKGLLINDNAPAPSNKSLNLLAL